MGNRGIARSPRRSGPARVLCLLLAATMVAGCYRNTPLANGPEPGMRVMLQLTREGTERLSPDIGHDIIRVEGETAAVHADRWDLRLIHTYDRLGREYTWQRETVSFPRAYVNEVERREFDRRRSFITAGVVTVAAVVLGRTFLRALFGEDTGGPPVTPPQ